MPIHSCGVGRWKIFACMYHEYIQQPAVVVVVVFILINRKREGNKFESHSFTNKKLVRGLANNQGYPQFKL